MKRKYNNRTKKYIIGYSLGIFLSTIGGINLCIGMSKYSHAHILSSSITQFYFLPLDFLFLIGGAISFYCAIKLDKLGKMKEKPTKSRQLKVG